VPNRIVLEKWGLRAETQHGGVQVVPKHPDNFDKGPIHATYGGLSRALVFV